MSNLEGTNPELDDPVVKYDEALKAFLSQLSYSDIEGLQAAIAEIERRITNAGG
jgi:hypothetical protein